MDSDYVIVKNGGGSKFVINSTHHSSLVPLFDSVSLLTYERDDTRSVLRIILNTYLV